MVSILVANVYINSLEEWLLWGLLHPCYKKLKNSKFSKRLEAVSIECDLYKILFELSRFRLNAFFVRFGPFFMLGRK